MSAASRRSAGDDPAARARKDLPWKTPISARSPTMPAPFCSHRISMIARAVVSFSHPLVLGKLLT
jgi:hypothetical protein